MPLTGPSGALDVQLASIWPLTGVNSMVNRRQFGLQLASVSHASQVEQSFCTGGRGLLHCRPRLSAHSRELMRVGGLGFLSSCPYMGSALPIYGLGVAHIWTRRCPYMDSALPIYGLGRCPYMDSALPIYGLGRCPYMDSIVTQQATLPVSAAPSPSRDNPFKTPIFQPKNCS